MHEVKSNIASQNSCIECSPDPLGSIRAAEVLWHQCDRINTSKAVSGPTAASHRQYSTFHVLLRFTTISRKPTASQTGKDNGANLLLSRFPSASVEYVKCCVFDERLEFNRLKSGKDIWLCHMARMQRSILRLTFRLKLLLRACVVLLFMMQTFDSGRRRKNFNWSSLESLNVSGLKFKSFRCDVVINHWWGKFCK